MLSPQHSKALLDQAVAEGIVVKSSDRSRDAKTQLPTRSHNLLAQQAIDAVVSHEKIILTDVLTDQYDLGSLEAEDLFAAAPVNIGTAFTSIGNELRKPSPQMDDLAERALILEPLLLRGVWDYLCNYPANSKKIPKDLKRAMRRKELPPPTDPDFYSSMRAIPISVRRHIWRYGMTFQVQSNSILNRNSHLLDATHKWLTKDRKNLELFVAVWGAFPILWELVVLYRVLTTEHYIQTAQKYDACMTHSSKIISYERLGKDEVLYRIGELRRNALAAVRLELNPKRKAARTNLTLQEALTVRKQPEVQRVSLTAQ